MRSIAQLVFRNSFARLHPAFYEVVDPTPLPDPYLVTVNPDAARLLDLDPSIAGDPDLVPSLAGNRRLPGSEPLAQAYAGHQFGVWVPQLGDGRAILLGEVQNSRGETWDLHLKGAGRTRFSRFGDGRSVLRSAIREYLASEALHGLGIPTTRALGIVGSDLPVQRERVETAATLLRLAPSHVRFGTFEFFASRGELDRLGELLDYVITRHFAEPSVIGPGHRGISFFQEVCRRTARLLAAWMAAGFAHGVMNTDNMSVLGITLDYGPYGFLDSYDRHFICNHTDTEGRYAFDQQPAVAMWNCARLGEALMTLDSRVNRENPDPEALEAWQAALESYWPAFTEEYTRLMRSKLGLHTAKADDVELVGELLAMLQEERADYTGFFRGLHDFAGNSDPWYSRYAARLGAEGSNGPARSARMKRANPKYVLRNWIAQEVIERAERKEFGPIEEVRRVLADPFEEHPGMERFAEPPSAEAREIVVSCSS